MSVYKICKLLVYRYLCPTCPIISPPISTIIICEHDSQALHFFIVIKLVEIKRYQLVDIVAKHNQDRTRFHILFLYSHKMLFIKKKNYFIEFKKD
jgi:hypothetical protein